jgi:hypothetical protein
MPSVDGSEWYVAERPDPEPNTFEIGLVLAGAVSAGAYTAGVLDFLFEALDTWHRAKRDDENAGRLGEDRTVPHHKVRVQVITGASAGGMNGAIAAVALRYDYPRAWSDDKLAAVAREDRRAPGAAVERNASPFYAPWVRRIDIRQLLGVADLNETIYSLLDCTVLDGIVADVLRYEGPRLEDRGVRGWLGNPLPLILTLSNLRGVPYQVIFRGEGVQAHEMSLHEDRIGFAVHGLGPGTVQPLPEDFRVLDPDQAAGWKALGQAALATGAFPIGLRARALERPGRDYDLRHPMIPPEGGALEFDRPAWPDGKAPERYGFVSVDGGVMNNEPFEIARRALAGLHGHNKREGLEANRAVVMVDPFIEPGPLGPEGDADLFDVATNLLRAMKNQLRFTFRDRALIQDEDVYSRFLVAPARGGVRGAKAIASGELGAFLGFVSEAYRHHDFMLGRRNCQRFLQASFTLPRENSLFDGAWSDAARTTWRDHDNAENLQIIPCVGACAVEEPLPKWPAGAFTYDKELSTLVENRTNRVVDAVLARATAQKGRRSLKTRLVGGVTSAYLWPLRRAVRGKIKEAVETSIKEGIASINSRRFP